MGGISSQIKVDFAFTTQMAKQGSDECVVNSMLIHASWEKTLGGLNITVCNGIGIKDQFPRPQGCYLCTSSKLHSSMTKSVFGLSPDLYSIEHMGNEIQSRCNAIQPRPTTTAEFGASVLMVWDCIPVAYILYIIYSMYKRCVAVINDNGGHARY